MLFRSRKTATATTGLVEAFGFSQQFRQQVSVGVGFKNGNGDYSSLLMRWSTARGALVYESSIVISYDEYDLGGAVVSKEMLWKLGLSEALSTAGGSEIFKEIKGDGFYRFIQSKLKDISVANIDRRVITKIAFKVAAAGEDLSTYIKVNSPSNSIVSDRPNFSNIEGGLGIFSSRTSILIDQTSGNIPIKLNFISQTELQNGQYTQGLKFAPN